MSLPGNKQRFGLHSCFVCLPFCIVSASSLHQCSIQHNRSCHNQSFVPRVDQHSQRSREMSQREEVARSGGRGDATKTLKGRPRPVVSPPGAGSSSTSWPRTRPKAAAPVALDPRTRFFKMGRSKSASYLFRWDRSIRTDALLPILRRCLSDGGDPILRTAVLSSDGLDPFRTTRFLGSVI